MYQTCMKMALYDPFIARHSRTVV